LFPELPEDLAAVADDDLATLLKEHEVATDLILNEDKDFTTGMSAAEVLEAFETGVAQIEAIRAEQADRVKAAAEYEARKAELAARVHGNEAEELSAEASEDDEDGEDEDGEDEDGEDELSVEEPEAVVAAAAAESAKVAEKPRVEVRLRRPPTPSADRMPDGSPGAVLVAAAGVEGVRSGSPLDRRSYAEAVKRTADRWGRVAKHDAGIEQRILCASASFPFPEERKLHASDWGANSEKIAMVVPGAIPGVVGQPLTASGGLCAPLEPIYSMPNFASQARPVRDSLPSFQADRGGVNVPAATSVGDITSAITVIEESEDALGGTFATKSWQALTCPAYTEVPVTVISHCREYGNLNAMAWPEKIAHENDLTMAAHARSAEGYLLDRIKALSVATTQVEVLGAVGDFLHAVLKAQAAIRFRLRMDRTARFRVLAPQYLPDLFAADTAYTQFDRFQSQNEIAAIIERSGISVTWYLDDIGDGTSQGFAAETASALDDFPDDVQWAIFPEGEFIHVDSGSLELGIVRDSTLNSTNDHQLFGETFENVARLGPAQGALWVTQAICPSGEFPTLGTALAC
jgi:hypothetical protein